MFYLLPLILLQQHHRSTSYSKLPPTTAPPVATPAVLLQDSEGENRHYDRQPYELFPCIPSSTLTGSKSLEVVRHHEVPDP